MNKNSDKIGFDTFRLKLVESNLTLIPFCMILMRFWVDSDFIRIERRLDIPNAVFLINGTAVPFDAADNGYVLAVVI